MNIIKLSDETKNYMKVITEQMESIGVLSDADRENLEKLRYLVQKITYSIQIEYSKLNIAEYGTL